MPAGDAGLEPGPETACRAYPVEAEEALNAWMDSNARDGIWVSPAGWWYAAWMHRQAEIDRLREQLDEWESANSAVVDLRSLIESHMDTARGQWKCVAQLAAQQAVVDAARWIEEDGWTPATRGVLMNALVQLPAESAQVAQPEGERG